LCKDPSTATSSRSSPTIRSNAASASVLSASNTPASIHSSRRAQRRVEHLAIEDRLDVDPRRAGHQPDQDPRKQTRPGTPGPVTPQRVRLDLLW
jgi:hypothetical protein